VKEVLCNIAPVDSFHLLLGWAWLRFKILNLDERSLYLRHEGHKMKLKFMTPRQVMSAHFCPHSVFNFGYLIEFMCLKSALIDNSNN